MIVSHLVLGTLGLGGVVAFGYLGYLASAREHPGNLAVAVLGLAASWVLVPGVILGWKGQPAAVWRGVSVALSLLLVPALGMLVAYEG